MPELRPAVFFDRDGTLNVDFNYVHKAEDWEWITGAKESLIWLREQGYLLIVVTNQSGIGRGLYTEEQMHEMHREKLGDLVDAIYFCPHLPEDDCECRKPKPGMLLEAIEKFGIDKDKSFLVGDKDRDVEAAVNAGVRGYHFRGGNLQSLIKEILH